MLKTWHTRLFLLTKYKIYHCNNCNHRSFKIFTCYIFIVICIMYTDLTPILFFPLLQVFYYCNLLNKILLEIVVRPMLSLQPIIFLETFGSFWRKVTENHLSMGKKSQTLAIPVVFFLHDFFQDDEMIFNFFFFLRQSKHFPGNWEWFRFHEREYIFGLSVTPILLLEINKIDLNSI